MVFAMLFCVQKPYFYKNTIFATAAAACLRSSALSALLSVCSFADSNQTNSTALRLTSSLTVMYRCVVEMLRCPAKLASTNTLTPFAASDVRNVLRPLWLLAPLMPAALNCPTSACVRQIGVLD